MRSAARLDGNSPSLTFTMSFLHANWLEDPSSFSPSCGGLQVCHPRESGAGAGLVCFPASPKTLPDPCLPVSAAQASKVAPPSPRLRPALALRSPRPRLALATLEPRFRPRPAFGIAPRGASGELAANARQPRSLPALAARRPSLRPPSLCVAAMMWAPMTPAHMLPPLPAAQTGQLVAGQTAAAPAPEPRSRSRRSRGKRGGRKARRAAMAGPPSRSQGRGFRRAFCRSSRCASAAPPLCPLPSAPSCRAASALTPEARLPPAALAAPAAPARCLFAFARHRQLGQRQVHRPQLPHHRQRGQARLPPLAAPQSAFMGCFRSRAWWRVVGGRRPAGVCRFHVGPCQCRCQGVV